MPPTPFPRSLSGPLAWCIPSCFISFDSLSPSRVRVSLRLTSEPFRLPLPRGRNSYISLLPWAPFAGSRRMGTRDALLQIQMGTYANGVTCYYTFPYTNNVLIEPTPYVRRLRGERWAPRFSPPALYTHPPAFAHAARRKCGEDIRYAPLRENRCIDCSVVSPPPLSICIINPMNIVWKNNDFYSIYFDRQIFTSRTTYLK